MPTLHGNGQDIFFDFCRGATLKGHLEIAWDIFTGWVIAGSMKAPHLCQLEVRGYELDSFGHVNNSVYLNYLEFARWKMLNEHGITLARIQEWKRWPVISRVEISYLKPLFMGDLIEIRTTIPELRRASFAIDQKIYKANVLVTDARLTSVIVDERGVPASLPEAFRKLGAHSATGDQS